MQFTWTHGLGTPGPYSDADFTTAAPLTPAHVQFTWLGKGGYATGYNNSFFATLPVGAAAGQWTWLGSRGHAGGYNDSSFVTAPVTVGDGYELVVVTMQAGIGATVLPFDQVLNRIALAAEVVTNMPVNLYTSEPPPPPPPRSPVSAVLTRVRHTLLDPLAPAARWTDAELLLWASDAQRTVTSLYPESNTVNTLVTPYINESRIDLRDRVSPATPIAILRFSAAHDEVADREGSELKVVEKSVLDAFDPSWLSYQPAEGAYTTPTANGRYYKGVVCDPKDPLAFWLYPRANPAFRIWVTYTATPGELTATTDLLSLPDHWLSALHDYVCYRALSKDSVYGGASGKAEGFLASFTAQVSAFAGKVVSLAPTNARPPDEH